MIVAGYDGGVRIELDETEALDLANFLHQFYGGADSVVDHLSAELDDVMQIERESPHRGRPRAAQDSLQRDPRRGGDHGGGYALKTFPEEEGL
jgi:hypothetical protein